MLGDVLTRLASDTGLHITQKRTTLLNVVNISGRLLHKLLDCNKMFREVTLVVPVNKVVSLPAIIGELKGMRVHTYDTPFPLHSMGSPRYIKDVDDYRFKNWRDIGESPIHTSMTAVSQLTLITNTADDSEVIIVGQTDSANLLEESITMDELEKTTTNLFGPRIDSITCIARNRQSDIVIEDSNGTELATLYNNFSKSRYKIVDVSEIYFPQDTSSNESLIDVCYKVPERVFSSNADQFYAGDDYDEAWYHMSMFVFLQGVPERANEAAMHNAAALAFCKAGRNSSEGAQEKYIQFGKNRIYDAMDFSCDFIPNAFTKEPLE